MKINKYQALAFLFGLGSAITVRIIGIFAISDIISLIFLPFLLIERNLFREKLFSKLILFLILWMVSTFLSDIYNKTDLLNSLKGFFTLIPFFSCLVFSYWLLKKNLDLINWFLWGYIFSFILSAGLGFDAFYIEMIKNKGVNSIEELGHYNKIFVWIISSFITGAFSITYFRFYPKLVLFFLFVLSLFQLFEGSRGLFLITFSCSLFIFYFLRLINYNFSNFLNSFYFNFKKLSMFIFQFGIVLFLSYFIYFLSVTNGLLGETELEKFQIQKDTKIGLLSGRKEFVSSFLAIKDSPIFGHGSFAVDKKGYAIEAALITGDDYTYNVLYKTEDEFQIPAHSHIWHAWVTNGFLGAFFWFFVLFKILLKFFRYYLLDFPKYLAFALLALGNAFWNILFSPFSQKPYLSMIIIFFIVIMEISNKVKN